MSDGAESSNIVMVDLSEHVVIWHVDRSLPVMWGGEWKVTGYEQCRRGGMMHHSVPEESLDDTPHGHCDIGANLIVRKRAVSGARSTRAAGSCSLSRTSTRFFSPGRELPVEGGGAITENGGGVKTVMRVSNW